MKYIGLLFLIIFLSACSSTSLFEHNTTYKALSFKVDSAKVVTYSLPQAKVQNQFDGCTSNSYTIEDANVFIEHIHLDSQCKWNGAANGYFEYQLKEHLKLKSLIALERIEKEHYTFSKLLVNGETILYTIHIWGVFKDTFILDYSQDLTKLLQKELNVSYQVEENKPSFLKRYNLSLVRMNFIKGYFNQDAEVIIK